MTTTIAPQEPAARPRLTLSDRCDRCGAGALVVAIMRNHKEVMFCKHHFEKHEKPLRKQALRIVDERSVLLNR